MRKGTGTGTRRSTRGLVPCCGEVRTRDLSPCASIFRENAESRQPVLPDSGLSQQNRSLDSRFVRVASAAHGDIPAVRTSSQQHERPQVLIRRGGKEKSGAAAPPFSESAESADVG